MWKRRVVSEQVVYKGITFRRYPNAKQWSHRVYYRPHGGHVARGIQHLHQEIWKDAHGDIPAGYSVHHKDNNPSNNVLDNLECIPEAEHAERHAAMARGICTERQRESLMVAQERAKVWHKSDAGREWHRQHGRVAYSKRPARGATCKHCGKVFQTKKATRAFFCSTRCRQQSYTADGRLLVTRTCVICSSEFRNPKSRPARTCSPRCRYVLNGREGKGLPAVNARQRYGTYCDGPEGGDSGV
jgi:hypothetical protein